MRRMRRPGRFAAGLSWRLWPLCGIWLVAAPGCRSQSAGTGTIEGVVEAQGNAALGGFILVRSASDGVSTAAEVAEDGSFSLVDVSPGGYTVEMNRADGAHASLDVTVVAGEPVALEVRSGRGSIELQVRRPETPATGEPDENGDGLMSARGLPAIQNGTTLDGVGATQMLGGVPLGIGREAAVDPNDDADSAEQTTGPSHGLSRGRHAGVAYGYAEGSVREFRVGTDAYSAQAGSAGGVLTATTRSGGDALHGSAAFNLRSSALAAKSPLAIATSFAATGNGAGTVTSGEVKPRDLRENVSATLGGPFVVGVGHGSGMRPRLLKLRFFYAGDVQRRGFPAISSPADANFYNLTAIQQDLLANRGVSLAQISSGLSFLSSLTGETPRRQDQSIHFGRVDWPVKQRFGLGVEYNRVRWNSPAGLVDAPVVARGRASLGNAAGSVDQALGRISVGKIGPVSLEVRLAFTRDLQYETPQTPLAQEEAIGPGGLSPEVNIGPDGLLFGTPAGLSQVAYPDEQRSEASNVATLARGRHLVQFGGMFAYGQERVATLGNAAGTFRYDSGATGGKAGGLVDFLTDFAFSAQAVPNGGCPKVTAATHDFCFTSYTQSFGETKVAFSTQDWAGFVEDSWKASERLRIHAGVRYEYTLLPFPQQPNPALDATFGARGATSVFPEDRNNLGPRVAVAFEPLGRGRLLVKAGYGMYFGRMPGATIQAALSDTGESASTVRIRLRPTTVAECPQVANQGFGYLCSFTAQPTGVVAATTSAVVFDRRFRLPVVQQGSLEVEREIRRGTTLSLEYVHNSDRQLPTSTDINIAPSAGLRTFQLQGGTGAVGVRDGETFAVPVYTDRVSTEFGPVTDVVSHANAYYDGATVRVRTQPAARLMVDTRATWSKSIDYGPSASATPRTNGQFDPFADGYDKGLSSLNYPLALHAEAEWTSGTEGSRRKRPLAEAWTIAAIETARSGRPYSYDVSGGTYLAGGHESLNGSGGAQYLPTLGRNTLRLPPTIKTDMKLAKGFEFKGKLRGVASAEVLNALNHQNISSVNQRAYLVGTAVDGVTPLVFQNASEITAEGLNTTAFGTPTSTGSSLNRERQVQFSVKMSF